MRPQILAILALAACAPHAPEPHTPPESDKALTGSAFCGAGNPLCATGGRPAWIVFGDGTGGLAPPGWRPVKGRF